MLRNGHRLTSLALGLGLAAPAATGLLQPAPVPPPAGSPAPPVSEFAVDSVHSGAFFGVRHFGVSNFYGRFNHVEGTIHYDPGDPASSSVEIRVRADSVDTNATDRDEHLKGPDFFNAKRYPWLSFKSTKVEKGEGDILNVTGDLSIRGQTKSLTVPVRVLGEGETPQGYKAGFEARFQILRSEFGVRYGLPDALGDEVDILLAIEAVRKA